MSALIRDWIAVYELPHVIHGGPKDCYACDEITRLEENNGDVLDLLETLMRVREAAK